MNTRLRTDAPGESGRVSWLLILIIYGFGTAIAPSLSGQTSPATLPDLNLSKEGVVKAIAIEEDGKIVIGGSFFEVNGVPRKNIARINPNGSVDASWNPEVDGPVKAIVLGGTDAFITGSFSRVNGQSRIEVAKLNLSDSGASEGTWNPDLAGMFRNPGVDGIALSETSLYVLVSSFPLGGGSASDVVKVSRSGSGAVDPAWNPEAWSRFGFKGAITGLAVGGTNVYLGGYFDSIRGTPRHGLARLNEAGAVDPNWDPSPDTPDFSGIFPWRITISGTAVYVAGDFTRIGGQIRNGLARLDIAGTGAADPIWNPALDGTVHSLSVTDSAVYVAGHFNNIGGQSRKEIAKLSATGAGAIDPTWDPNPDTADDRVHLVDAVVATGGFVLVGGDFQRLSGSLALGIGKLDAVTGGRDDSFAAQVQVPAGVNVITRLPDGELLVGGDFLLAENLPHPYLARLHADGTFDRSWSPQPDGPVTHIVGSGSDVYVAGAFTSIGGVLRNGLAKLSGGNRDAADPDWDPNPDGAVGALVVGGNSVFVAGQFTHIGGQNRNYLAKVSMSGAGGVDAAWNPNPDNTVSALALGGADLFVAGTFRTIGGQSRANLVKIATIGIGTPEPLWNPNSLYRGSPRAVDRLALAGSNLYVAGFFDSIGGLSRTFLAKLDAGNGGAADPIWNPRLDDEVSNLAATETTVYVEGFFSKVGGENRSGPARLSTTGTGRADSTWNPDPDQFVTSFVPSGAGVYAGGQFTVIAGSPRYGLAFLPVADAPVLIERTNATVVLRRNAENGPEVTHFRIVDVTGGAWYENDGVTAIPPGGFITVAQGEAGLKFVAAAGTTNGQMITAVSALNNTPEGAGTAAATLTLGSPQGPVFGFSSANYSVSEASNLVTVTIRKWGKGAATVQVFTSDGTALIYDLNLNTGDYRPASGTLTFPDGEADKSFTVSIIKEEGFKGDRTFWINLTNATAEARLAYPANAAITIIEADPFGPTQSYRTNRPPADLVLTNPGVLQVYLEPARAFGQWRLAGEFFWRSSGEGVTGLPQNNYVIEFKSLTNYYDLPEFIVPVIAGHTNVITNFYAAKSILASGQLSVVINPPSVATNADNNQRGRWRLLGEADWHDSGQTLSNLNAGGHVVEFKQILNFARPLNREVKVHGGANVRDQVEGNYLVLPGVGGLIPQVLNFSEMTDTNGPYLYNGQLQTDVGVSSGVVVKERVVLTAAHALYNDGTREWVTEARWFFQEHAGVYQAVAQTPRGWYVDSGYATQRSNDLSNGTSPGYSTPESQQMDAAALYFVETAYSANEPGRGGYSGYLSSTGGATNEYLLSDWNKLLVGYPLVPGAETYWGKMYATMPANLHFVSLNPKVFRTTDIVSYPGNSGGPLYVQWTNRVYYPAGIYLGGGAQSLVRAIDSEVVDLINRAEVSGNGGGNFNGGGVITISPRYTAATFASGYVRVRLGPPTAVAAGGAWRVSARNLDYTSDPNARIPLVGGGDFLIEFRPVTGWLLPTNQIAGVAADQETILDAYYIDARPSLGYRLGEGLSLYAGETGVVYRIDYANNLGSPINWIALTNVTLSNSLQTISATEPTNGTQRYFRAVGQSSL